jgi:hypothetical protein
MACRAIRHHLLNPYDGNSIGTAIGDAIRNIVASVSSNGIPAFAVPSGALQGLSISILTLQGATGAGGGYAAINFDASRVVPTSHENRPASVSAQFVITY